MIYPYIDIDQLKALQGAARHGSDEAWYEELYKVVKMWQKYEEQDKERGRQKLSEEKELHLLNEWKTELSREWQELSWELSSYGFSPNKLFFWELSSCKWSYELILSQVLGTAISMHRDSEIKKSYIDLIKYILEKAENFKIFEKPKSEEFDLPQDPIHNLMSPKPEKEIIKLVLNFVEEHSDWSKIFNAGDNRIANEISCCSGYARDELNYDDFFDDMHSIISVIYDELPIAGSLNATEDIYE